MFVLFAVKNNRNIELDREKITLPLTPSLGKRRGTRG